MRKGFSLTSPPEGLNMTFVEFAAFVAFVGLDSLIRRAATGSGGGGDSGGGLGGAGPLDWNSGVVCDGHSHRQRWRSPQFCEDHGLKDVVPCSSPAE